MPPEPQHSSTRTRFVPLNDLTVDPAYADWLRQIGLDSLEALFAWRDGESLNKPGLDRWRTRMRVIVRDQGAERILYLKRFDHPHYRARCAARRSGSGAGSLAGNEWAWIERLLAAGIPCLRAVAFGEHVRRGRELRSAIITAPVPGKSLESWCAMWTLDDRDVLRSLIPATAALLAELHAAGFIHRDLYLSHLYFDPQRPIEDSLRLIDLARVIRPWCRMRRWVVKDLAALNYSAPTTLITRADRVRWLRAYLNTPRLGADGKSLAYRVLGKSSSIARRDARKRR